MKRALLALSLALLCTQSVFAAVTITATQDQVAAGGTGMVNPTREITGTSPWDFSGTSYLSLTGIDEISVTLRLQDGDTDFGDYDIGELMLELDGLNTGVALDGFTTDLVITKTVTGTNQAAGLLAALQTDGLLLGKILDLSPNDNWVYVLPEFTATLSLTDNDLSVVPVPGAFLLSSLGAGAAAALKRRRLFSA